MLKRVLPHFILMLSLLPPFYRRGSWDSESLINMSRPEGWCQTRVWTHYSDFKARLSPCFLAKPGTGRKTSEVSFPAHLLCWKRHSGDPVIPDPVGDSSSPRRSLETLPRCDLGSRLLTEDAHGCSFLPGSLHLVWCLSPQIILRASEFRLAPLLGRASPTPTS